MSNLYSKASLVMDPQLVDTGKVYSIKPENRRGDFTFTRSSAATRVNADGLVEKETQNLLVQSNNFATTWGRSNTSVTGGQSSYDGSSDAWLLSKSAASGQIGQNTTSSGVNTFSVYAKANVSPYVRLTIFEGGFSANGTAYFDLQNGVLGTTNAIDSSIENVGNGWYRCSVTFNTSNQKVYIYPADGDNDTSGTSGSIYIQDAQLNQGLIAQEVITTTTTAVEGGITDNVPRLDYTDSSCPALLLEPQRTNVVTQSEYTGLYNGVNSTQEFNAATSPEGVQNAVKIVANTSNSQHNRFASISTTGAHTFSVFAKAAEYNFAQLYGGGAAGSRFSVVVDLTDGSIDTYDNITTDQIDIQDYGSGWYRIIVSNFTSASTFSAIAPIKEAGLARDAGYDIDYAGDNTSGAYFYGMQVEAGSYATSYIPTYGSSVTRVGETCGDAGNASTFNDSEGVLYLEIAALADDGTNRGISISDGTATNRITFLLSFQSNTLRVFGVAGGLQFNLQNSSFNTLNYNKIAVLYQLNNFKFFINGTQIGSSTSGAVPIGLNSIAFDNGSGGLNFYGKVNQVIVFPTALSDEELATLTTI